MMVNNRVHTAGILVLLISLSLGLSTLHNHDSLIFHHSDQSHGVEQTVSLDSSFCPISGFLVYPEYSSFDDDFGLVEQSSLLPYNNDRAPKTIFIKYNQVRAPPVQA